MIAPRIVSSRSLSASSDGTDNDYALSRVHDVFLLTATGAGWTISGFSGWWKDREVWIVAIAGGVNLTIQDEGAGSVAANRVSMIGGANAVLTDNDSLLLKYNVSASRWIGIPHT